MVTFCPQPWVCNWTSFCVRICVTHRFLPVDQSERWGTQTTAGELCGCCPGEVRTSSNRPTRSSRASPTTSTAWSANWPKSCRWGLPSLRELIGIYKTTALTMTRWHWFPACRRIFPPRWSIITRHLTLTQLNFLTSCFPQVFCNILLHHVTKSVRFWH